MESTLTDRIINWTASFTLHAVDRGAVWADRLNRKVIDSFFRKRSESK